MVIGDLSQTVDLPRTCVMDWIPCLPVKLTSACSYRWSRDTFKADFTESEIADNLPHSIRDVVRVMVDEGVLSVAELNRAEKPLDQVHALFNILDSRNRDAHLIGTFQRAVIRVIGMQPMLREGLEPLSDHPSSQSIQSSQCYSTQPPCFCLTHDSVSNSYHPNPTEFA